MTEAERLRYYARYLDDSRLSAEERRRIADRLRFTSTLLEVAEFSIAVPVGSARRESAMERGEIEAYIVVRSPNAASLLRSLPRAPAYALAEPRIVNPHFSSTQIEAALSRAALA